MKKFNTNKITSNLIEYKKLNSKVNFNKKSLEYLLDKNNEIEMVKIIRRNKYLKHNIKQTKTRLVIKFELKVKSSNENITPDIIKKIEFLYLNTKYIIHSKNIFYDNTEITAYIDLNENININNMIILNHFSGSIKANNILNIRGSDKTRKMLSDTLDKLFLIPFFKLIEIFYISKNYDKKYEELKKENFGSNFDNLKILEPFKKQINTF